MAHFPIVLKHVLVLFFICSAFAQQCDQPIITARFDCYPEPLASQDKCLARNCCWNPVNQLSKVRSTNNSLEVNVPACYYPRDFPTYRVMTNETTTFGQRLIIVKEKSTYMPNEILNLTVDLYYETAQRFRLRIYDSTKKRFEVPMEVPVVRTKVNVTDYEVSINQAPFAILVKRKSTGATM